jgi:hypothetical protein
MQKLKINGVVVFQPDEGLQYDFETTYTEDTERVRTGKWIGTPLFTVESLGYTATNIPVAQASQILSMVVGKTFQLTYPSSYYGTWRTGEFYVGKGSMAIGRWNDATQILDSLSFNMIGVNPI